MSKLMTDALIACDPTRSVVVEACAGSGKTWLLTSRVFRLLLAGAKPDEILAITFTRKAAQEMRQRITSLLRECALASEDVLVQLLQERGAPVDAASLQMARNLAGQVLTSSRGITVDTFHGWFTSLCQLAPLSTGFSRQSEPTEQPEFWRAKAIDQMVARLLTNALEKPVTDQHQVQNADHQLAYKLAYDRLAANLDRNALQTLLLRALGQRVALSLVMSNPDAPSLHDIFMLEEGASWPDQLLVDPQLGAQYLADWDYACRALGQGTDTQKAKATEAEMALTDFRTGVADAADTFDVLKGVCLTEKEEVRSAFVKPSKPQQKCANLDLDVMVGIHERIVEQTLSALGKAADLDDLRTTQALMTLLPLLFATYDQVKAEQGICDFDDLEATALNLLMDEDQRAYMQQKLDRRVRHLLVDEFQDTNPVQWNILRHWLEDYSKGDQPTVFLVGDPKQSIYRFRRAEARLFNEAREWLRTRFDAACLESDTTRRCALQVVQAVNRTLAEGGQHGRTPFRPHTSLAEPVKKGFAGLRLMPLAGREDGTDPLAPESKAVVDCLLHYQSTGEIENLGDVLVLVRTHRSGLVLAQALREAGVEFVLQDKGERYTAQIWSDTVALFEFLDNPHNNLALLQVLRSPLFAVDSRQMLALIQQGGVVPHGNQAVHSAWTSLAELSEANPKLTGSAPWNRIFSILSSWLQTAQTLPLFETVSQVASDTQASLNYLSVAKPRERLLVAEHWDWLKAWALNVNKGRFPTLRAALDEALGLMEYQASDGESASTDSKRMRIMTVHSAKGLEAEHVWLFDANATPRGQDTGLTLLLDWPLNDAYPRAITVKRKESKNSQSRAGVMQIENQAYEDEEDHLLYVALTRAKKAVYVSGRGDFDKNGMLKAPSEKAWYGWLKPYADEVLEVWPGLEGAAPGSSPPGQTLQGVLNFEPEMIEWIRPQCPAVLPLAQGVGRVAERIDSSELRMGSAWHGVLEWIDLAKPNGSDGSPPFETWWLDRQYDCEDVLGALDADELAQVKAAAQLIYEHEALRPWMQDAPQAFNELEWTLPDGRFLRADRVVKLPEGWLVLDYKWSVNESNFDKYRQQVQQYIDLVNSTLGVGHVSATQVSAAQVSATSEAAISDPDSTAYAKKATAASTKGALIDRSGKVHWVSSV
ncbi:MAG: UvrD-helicase domain-containing protein [Limnobacter sp.]|nr:UvrD-helicase domain-containing protein [Limnobacter sp.]